MSIRELLLDRIGDHIDEWAMLTPEQHNEVAQAGFVAGAHLSYKYREAYMEKKYGHRTDEELVEILVERVRDYVRQEQTRDF